MVGFLRVTVPPILRVKLTPNFEFDAALEGNHPL
jgi:hypothetical protein